MLFRRLFNSKLRKLEDSFEQATQLWVFKLTVVREVLLHRRHVQEVERCDGEVYSCFNDPAVQSHIFRRPSGDKSAKIRPLLPKAQRAPSIFHGSICTWDQSCLFPVLSLAMANKEWKCAMQENEERRNNGSKRKWSEKKIVFVGSFPDKIFSDIFLLT